MMMKPKHKCGQHLSATLAALSAAVGELEDAVAILKRENAGLVGHFTSLAAVKMYMISSLLELLENDPSYQFETSHKDETEKDKFFQPPTDPTRN
jgi:hypothetical protein